MESLKRKLKADKEDAYNKRAKLEEEKKEKKKVRERERYHQKKNNLASKSEQDQILFNVPPSQDSQSTPSCNNKKNSQKNVLSSRNNISHRNRQDNLESKTKKNS